MTDHAEEEDEKRQEELLETHLGRFDTLTARSSD
jgi:hypothetical protein